MPLAETRGVSLYYEAHGRGTPILWCHEYFGDYRSWGPQLSRFSRHYRNIVYSARGYPRSSAPDEASAYSQDLMVDDALAVLDHAGAERAFVAGLSMGGNIALNFGLRHPGRCLGLVIAGCGSGSSERSTFEERARRLIEAIEREGAGGLVTYAGLDASRAGFRGKDPAGYADFAARLLDRSPRAAAHVYREVQLKRPSVFELTEAMAATATPSLVIFGDEDRACVEPGLHMWRSLPHARLAVFPATGHCVNLEEPALFNDVTAAFFADVSAGVEPR